MRLRTLPVRGRGAQSNPSNRFERIHVEPEPHLEGEEAAPRTEVLRDNTRDIIARNQSPDVGFDVGINPYRGCEHGCIYCYARPGHEYLGFSAGLDFETKILAKTEAPRLLRQRLASPAWVPQTLGMSGVTDPYQPLERRLRLTRGCLEVLAQCRHPVALVTKNHLVTRDIDLLSELAEHGAVSVTLSITSLRRELQRIMEPRTSIPERRLAAVANLTAAGIPVNVNLAPVIPGLNDHEIPAILEAAAAAGAKSAAFLMLRLPHGVASLFEAWLEQHFPDRKRRVLSRIRGMRGGKLNDSRFWRRSRGAGEYAEQIEKMFRVARARVGLDRRPPALATHHFRPPPGIQRDLFVDSDA